MNITFFVDSLAGGGAERVACSLANYFGRNNQVTILTMMETKENYKLDSCVEVQHLVSLNDKYGFIKKNYIRYKKLKEYIKRNHSDLYIVFLPITICLFLHFKKYIDCPVIISERNDPNSYSNVLKRVLLFYSKRANGIVYQTNQAKDWYEKNGVNVSSRVIPNAIREEVMNITPFEGVRRNAIVAVGRLNEQKNYELLIDAFGNISKLDENVVLEIYGDGPKKEELILKVKRMNLEDRVIFKGFVSDVLNSIRSAKIYVLSSNYEGMPNSLMEAMAIGLPCIATRCPCGGPEFLIQNNINGLLVDVNDVDMLYASMLRLLKDGLLADRLSAEARKVNELLNQEVIYQEWEEFINKINNFN